MLFGVLIGPRPPLLIEGLDDTLLLWRLFLLLELETRPAVIVLRQHHAILNIKNNSQTRKVGLGYKRSEYSKVME